MRLFTHRVYQKKVIERKLLVLSSNKLPVLHVLRCDPQCMTQWDVCIFAGYYAGSQAHFKLM